MKVLVNDMIEYKIEQDRDDSYEYVMFQITRQSGVWTQFNRGYNNFDASNGVTLISASCPEYSSSDTLFVRGDNTRLNNMKVRIPVDNLSRVIDAIEEYNESFLRGW